MSLQTSSQTSKHSFQGVVKKVSLSPHRRPKTHCSHQLVHTSYHSEPWFVSGPYQVLQASNQELLITRKPLKDLYNTLEIPKSRGKRAYQNAACVHLL